MFSNFGFYVSTFKDGIAAVQWCLQPDGRYYADEDGFGATRDFEIWVTAFIDKSANLHIPFQPMTKEQKALYQEQSRALPLIPMQIGIFVFLLPNLTIPLSENRNLRMHKDKLHKIVRGMMYRLKKKFSYVHKYFSREGQIRTDAAINTDPEHYLGFSLVGRDSEQTAGRYEVFLITSINKKGEEPKGFYTKLSDFNLYGIYSLMMDREKATEDFFIDDILDSVEKLYDTDSPQL